VRHIRVCNLVGNEQDVVVVAPFAHGREVRGVGDVDAAFALDGSRKIAQVWGVRRLLQRLDVVEGYVDEAARQRAERLACSAAYLVAVTAAMVRPWNESVAAMMSVRRFFLSRPTCGPA